MQASGAVFYQVNEEAQTHFAVLGTVHHAAMIY